MNQKEMIKIVLGEDQPEVLSNKKQVEERKPDWEMEKLSKLSTLAREMYEKNVHYKVHTIIDWNKFPTNQQMSYLSENGESIGFHPTGPCGCILLDDEYFYDIRCEHLIFIEGWTEGYCRDSILLIGNHKGGMIQQLIIFDKTV